MKKLSTSADPPPPLSTKSTFIFVEPFPYIIYESIDYEAICRTAMDTQVSQKHIDSNNSLKMFFFTRTLIQGKTNTRTINPHLHLLVSPLLQIRFSSN